MRKKGWKGKEALMAMTPEEAKEYVNRKDRRAGTGTGQKTPAGGIKELAEKFGESMRKAREEAEKDSGDGIDMPMPDRQSIEENAIIWYWENYTFQVTAHFAKVDGLVNDHNKGDYWVTLWTPKDYDDKGISGHDAGVLAGVLASAYKWEGLWRQHAGEYLALDGALEPVESDAAQG